MERGRPRSLPRTSTLHCSTAPLLHCSTAPPAPLQCLSDAAGGRAAPAASLRLHRPTIPPAQTARRRRPRRQQLGQAVRRTARHTARNAKTARKRPDAQSERSPRQRGTTRAPLTPALPSESPRRPTKAPASAAWCHTLWRTRCHRPAPMRGRRRPSVGSARRRCALEARFRPAAARTAGARCRRDENGASGRTLQHSQAPPPSSCNFTDPVEGIGVILLEG